MSEPSTEAGAPAVLDPSCGNCTALSLQSSQKCASPAFAPQPPFCAFHKKQCQALYAGYKRRNAELTDLESTPPSVLPRNIGTNDFSAIGDVGVLTAIHEYLRKKYNLLNRCVLARELHHQHFYSDTSDYGHQAYLDKLKTARALLTGVLGRLERRVLQVRYEQEEWYAWIQKLQTEEEERVGAEKKRIKAAAELERKHEAKISMLKAEEQAKYWEELEKEEVWDPIESRIGEIRMGYIALLKAMLKDKDLPDDDKAAAKERASAIGASLVKGGGLGRLTGSREEHLEKVREERRRTKDDFVAFAEGEANDLEDDLDDQLPFGKPSASHTQLNSPSSRMIEEKLNALRANKKQAAKGSGSAKPKKTGKKGRKNGKKNPKKTPQNADAEREGESDIEEITRDGDGHDAEDEDEEALVNMLRMLKTGRPDNVDLEKLVVMPDFSLVTMKDGKVMKKGPDTDETPEQAASPYRDIIRAIRHLWHFVDEIKPRYYDVDYPEEEDMKRAQEKLLEQVRAIREYQLLRLVLSNSSLLGVALECESIEQFLNDTERVRNTDLRDLALGLSKTTMQDVRDACSDCWLNATMKERQDGDPSATAKCKGKSKAPEEEKLKRVRVCGRWLHHYPMESRLPRRGWFLFGLLTFASYSTALSLCQSWDEAFELSILSMHGYFSALPQSWAGAHEPEVLREARRIGFLTYARSGRADKATKKMPFPGGLGSGYMESEARNYICGNMSREDPRARRFIKMAEATTSELCIWVKDCRTGKVIYKPPPEETWITRVQAVGKNVRACLRGWDVQQAMDAKFREQIEATRPWKLAFPDYLEVHIWDRHAGRHLMSMMSVIMKLLNKAYFLTDQISNLCSTLDVFQRIAIEEGGPEGEHARRAKEIRKNLRKLRKREEFKEQLLSPDPRRWYDDLDKYLDKCKPWYECYWSEADADERMPALRTELAKIEKGEVDSPDQLDWVMKDIMEKVYAEKAMKRRLMQQFDEDSDDDDKKREAPDDVGAASGSSPDWEDNAAASQHEEIWEEAEDKADELEEFATDLADVLYDMCLAMAPGFDKEKHEANRRAISRSITLDMQKTLSPKERMREARRLDLVTQSVPTVIPANFWFCNVMVQMIMSRSFEDIDMHEMWEQSSPDIEWSQFALLRDNDLRAKNLPPRRPSAMPKKVIEDWEEHMKHWDLLNQSNGRLTDPASHMPKEWIQTIMERIILLWKGGHIVPSYNLGCMPIFAGREEGNGPLHMYCDFRAYRDAGMLKAASHTPEGLKVTPPKGPDQLKREMEKWEARNPSSTYSLLKMKSEFECWPIDMPDNTRHMATILDPTGRIWEFETMPKDFPLSDVDMHMQMALLLVEAPDFGGKETEQDKITYWVKHRIDVILVCSRTPKESRIWTTKAAAYFRKKPRGLEIDWARSYLGVKADWLRNVPEKVWL